VAAIAGARPAPDRYQLGVARSFSGAWSGLIGGVCGVGSVGCHCPASEEPERLLGLGAWVRGVGVQREAAIGGELQALVVEGDVSCERRGLRSSSRERR
jgi:hypothetical protein